MLRNNGSWGRKCSFRRNNHYKEDEPILISLCHLGKHKISIRWGNVLQHIFLGFFDCIDVPRSASHVRELDPNSLDSGGGQMYLTVIKNRKISSFEVPSFVLTWCSFLAIVYKWLVARDFYLFGYDYWKGKLLFGFLWWDDGSLCCWPVVTHVCCRKPHWKFSVR